MLPIGLAEKARTTRAVKRDEVIARSGVELPEDSFVESLRRLQETASSGGEG